MTPEAFEAPIDHMKISDAILKVVIIKLYNLEAFEKEAAVLKEALQLENMEHYAFRQLVEEGAILELEDDETDDTKYYLSEEFKPVKSYRKQVVMGMSIPILVFLLLIIGAGLGAIIYQIIISFS